MPQAPAITAATDVSPFHEGEIAIQERLGVRDVETWARRGIRSHMPDQHRDFFTAQPFLIVSARDGDGRPWATLLEGGEGFVSSPSAETLDIQAQTVLGDALEDGLVPGADLGILGIELASRRRNRVNGTLQSTKDGQLRFAVGQSFGNCPQYIRERGLWWSEETPDPKVTRSSVLTDRQSDWIASADTFFIASGFSGASGERSSGMDVSHRGGEPGFVDILDSGRIRFPDYAGNNFFNTLGNILLDERAGFLFLDFSSGSHVADDR